MNKYCRLCLKEDFSKCFFDFSNILNDSFSVYECYQLLTSINLEHQDEKDNSKICKDCWLKLYSYYDFRALVLTSNDFISGLRSKGRVIDDPLNEKSFSPEEYLCLNDIKVELIEPSITIKEEENIDPQTEVIIIKREDQPVEPPKPRKKIKKSLQQQYHSEDFSSSSGNTKIRSKNRKLERTVCDQCGKSYRNVDLQRHIEQVHLRVLPYQCNYCSKFFSTKVSIRNHLFRHIKYKAFQCDFPNCEKKFGTASEVRHHKRNNHEEIIYRPCTYRDCKFQYKNDLLLKLHIERIHLGIKKHLCQDCGQSFSDLSGLIKHRAKHSDEKNFECEVCKERFKTKTLLGTHRKRTHEKPRYPCEFCGHGFHEPSLLKNHIKGVHEGIRSFVCKYCGKSYINNRNLVEHIKENHFKSKIICELCGAKLARSESYRKHVKARHSDIGEDNMTALLKRIKTIKADFVRMEFYYSCID